MHDTFFQIPMYVKAKTEDDLIRAMIQNNIKNGVTYKYFDIQKSAGFWYAWYIGNAEKMIKKRVDDGLKRDN